jgi:sentrin-specific protease 8
MSTAVQRFSKVICEVGDATLHESDVEILKQPNSWLNDQIITFYLEWWKRELMLSDETGQHRNPEVVMIHPTAAFMLRLLPMEDLVSSVAIGGNPFLQAQRDEIKLIIIPINNAQDPFEAGGSHWSLLVVDKMQHRAIHMDSSLGMNRTVALQTTEAIRKVLSSAQLKFDEPQNTEQQTNCYDCGVYVLLNIRRVLTNLGGNDDKTIIETDSTTLFRKWLLALIMTEAEKSAF